MTNLRKDAEGKFCLIRVPGACASQPVCLCHVRLIGISGMGHKATDLLGAFGCTPCHDVIDGRVKSSFSYLERRQMLLEGMARTQAQWVERELIRW